MGDMMPFMVLFKHRGVMIKLYCSHALFNICFNLKSHLFCGVTPPTNLIFVKINKACKTLCGKCHAQKTVKT